MKLPRDPASLQAMRYIQLFDEALKKRGVQVLNGIELEFAADIADGRNDREFQAKIIHGRFVDAPRHVKSSLAGMMADNLHALAPHGVRQGPVGIFYHEDQNRKYEVVTTISTPIRTAHRAAGLRKFIANYETAPDLFEWSRHLRRPLKNIEFDAKMPYGPTNGMHVNISLNAMLPDMPGRYFSLMLPEKNFDQPSPVMEHLKQKLWELNTTDMALLLSGPAALDRFLERQHDLSIKSGTMNKPDKDAHGDPYIEYHMPAADSNPYFAVLMAMAAAYNMLKDLPPKGANEAPLTVEEMQAYSKKHKKSEFASPKDYPYPDLPGSIYKADERFEKDSLVAKSMRDVAIESGVSAPEADQEVGRFKFNVINMREQSTLLHR